jgi:Ca2+-dependent lipid-binding protein
MCFLEIFGKQDPYVEFYLGTNWKHVTEPRMNAGTNPKWDCEISGKIAVAQIQRDPIRVRIMDKNDMRSDKIIGEGKISCMSLLAKLNSWVTIGGDLSFEQQPAGKFLAVCKFRPDTPGSISSFDQEAKLDKLLKMQSGIDSKALDKLAADLKAQQDALASKLGGIESAVRKQLHDV